MAHLNLNNRVISNINNEDLSSMLNEIIDTELSKDVNEIDIDFVDDCVDALLALEQETNDFTALVPLVSSEKFLRKLTNDKHSFRSLNVFARTAIAAAIIAGSTLTANAAVEAVTGVNVLHEVGVKIQYQLESWGWFDGEGIDVVEGIDDDGDDEEITTAPKETTTKPTTTKPSTTQPTTRYEGIDVIEGVDDDGDDEPTTTKTVTTTQPTTKYEGIDIMEGVDDEGDEDEPTTQPTTKPSVTSNNTVKPAKPSQKNLDNISADVTSFKTDYIYGEEFDPSGLKLYANYDDGTSEQISLSDCYFTKIEIGTRTADHELAVMYKTCKLVFEVTVRPDEETRGSQIRTNSEYDYLLTSRGAYITAYKGDKTALTINRVDDNTVVALCANVLSGTNVETVSSKTVTKIFENAFRSCKKLTKANFPKASYIGDNAFEACESLESIKFSDNIDYLGKSVFKETALTEIELPQSVTKIPDSLFKSCEKLTTVTLKGDVTEIGTSAFSDCTSLENIDGCEAVTVIGDYAFFNDEKLNFTTFPTALKKVGESGFFMCLNLEINDIPQTLTSIGKSSFAYCTKLTALTIPEGITVIPYEAFRGTGAKTVVIPEGVEIIEDYALRAVKATKITLPSSLKRIGSEAIYSPLLRQVYFGKNVESIADDAFYKGRSVTFYVFDDTYPKQWAIDNNIKYVLQ